MTLGANIPATDHRSSPDGIKIHRPRRSQNRILLKNMLLTLPQETLNHIIVYLHGEDHALRSLSLVHRRLTEECRIHLFSSIRIDSARKLRHWSNAVSPGKDGLSRYVRFLDMKWAFSSSPASLNDHIDHLRSFSRLEHLEIRPLYLETFPSQGLAYWFGHFSNIRSISTEINGSLYATLNFLALFPLLENTVITAPRVSGEEADPGFSNHVYRGDLVLKICRIDDADDFLPGLTRLSTPSYRRLGLGTAIVHNFAPLERFFNACGDSLESVQFINLLIREFQVSSLTAPYSNPTFKAPWVHCSNTLLSSLTHLRDIVLSLQFLNDHPNVLAMLSSITSTKINSVTLIVWGCSYPHDLENFCFRWTQIENALCRLSELRKRLESGGKVVLNVCFDDERLANEVSEFVGGREFMPRFQERGVIKVELEPMGPNRAMSIIVPPEFSSRSR